MPHLLSPAGLPAASTSGTGSMMSMSSHFLEDTRSLQVPNNTAAGRGSSSSTARAGRPGIKRTASTASVNERVMDMLNPSQQPAFVDSDDEEDGGIGVQEDWEVEEHDPFAASSSSGNSRTPPGSGSSGMLLDSPTSSPTLMTQSQQHRSSYKRPAAKSTVSIMKDMDDEGDNPFLSSGPPKASKKQRPSQRTPDKVSYVFRGKRITYDAPLESLFPAEDDDDMSLSLHAKSGPRVLFPSPPTPSTSASSLPSLQNVSPPSTSSTSSVNAMLLMQTPRRAPPSSSAAAALTTPAERITAALEGARANHSKKGETGDRKAVAPAPFIPPTPASLPQKSKAERTLERERLHGAMRGIQATNAAAAASHRGESAEARGRRYAPYPPR